MRNDASKYTEYVARDYATVTSPASFHRSDLSTPERTGRKLNNRVQLLLTSAPDFSLASSHVKFFIFVACDRKFPSKCGTGHMVLFKFIFAFCNQTDAFIHYNVHLALLKFVPKSIEVIARNNSNVILQIKFRMFDPLKLALKSVVDIECTGV